MRALREQIEELDGNEVYGRVVGVRGLMVEVAGPLHTMSVGARVVIETKDQPIPCEVVGFSGNNALLMPFAPLEGVRRGARMVRVHDVRETVQALKVQAAVMAAFTAAG
jgi:flagellum-specific ATP synthase